MPEGSMPALVARYFDLVNGDRVDELMELFDPDAEFLMPVSKPLRGRAEIRRFYAKLPALFPQHQDTPTRVWQDKASYAVEIDFVGTTADGRQVEFRAVDLMDLVDGRIQRLQSFYDSHGVLRQRGLA